MVALIRGMIAGARNGLIACLAFGALVAPAWADARLNAHYEIKMIGVTIGQITWNSDIAADAYQTSANGKASGALSMLVNGEGSVATKGIIENDMAENGVAENGVAQTSRLVPTFFSANMTEDGEIAGLQMTFEDGAVKTLRTDKPLRDKKRVPVSEADRRDVDDPLSAMLIPIPSGHDAMSPAICDRVLAIFDGQRRYNLALAFKRADRLAIKRGYAGPVLVCAVVLQPIAGYRADSMLVKYVGGKSDMEIWFAPVAGTSLVAPIRVSMPTMLGTLEIAADRFETAAIKPAPKTQQKTQPSTPP